MMNIYPSFTNLHGYLSHRFFSLRTTARREALWARLMGKTTTLAIFPDEAPEKSPNRTFLGVQEIPVEKIVGTLGRKADFDHQFRPMNKHLRERWVNTCMALERGAWSPILVHKVGENYYVEDGHHRVSVGRSQGLLFIPAKVWEYPCLAKEPEECQPEPCPERKPVRRYARVTE